MLNFVAVYTLVSCRSNRFLLITAGAQPGLC